MTDTDEPDNWLTRRLNRRLYRDLARSYEQDATHCRRNADLRPDRADYWTEEALRYLAKAVEYRDKERAAR